MAGGKGKPIEDTFEAVLRAGEAKGYFRVLNGGSKIEYLTNESGLNPILASLTSRTVASVIESAIGKQDIFKGLYESFKQSVLNIANLGVSGDNAWAQAQYLQRAINFSDIIQTKGLARAIEDVAAQVLHEDTISSILRTFNTVGLYIQDVLDGNKAELIQINGVWHKKINLPNGDYMVMTTDAKTIVEIKRGNKVLKGTFMLDQYGNLRLSNGSVVETFATYQQIQTIVGGQQVYVEMKDLQGNTMMVIAPNSEGGYLVYDSYGQYVNALLTNNLTSTSYRLNSGVLEEYNFLDSESGSVIWGFEFEGDSTLRFNLNTDIAGVGNLTSVQAAQLDAIMYDIQQATQPQYIDPSTRPPVISVGSSSEAQQRILTINDDELNPALKQQVINKLDAWLIAHPGLLPDIELVTIKETITEFEAFQLGYAHYNETVVQLDGNAEGFKIKIDPYTGDIFELSVDSNYSVYNGQDIKVDIGLKGSASFFSPFAWEILYSMASKYNGQEIASTTTALGYDLLGRTELIYESGGMSPTNPQAQINTVIKVSASTRNLILGAAAAVSLVGVLGTSAAAGYAAAGASPAIPKIYELLRSYLGRGVLSV